MIRFTSKKESQDEVPEWVTSIENPSDDLKIQKTEDTKMMAKAEITEKELEAVKTLIRFIGDDPEREGLQETPMRVLKAWRDYFGKGYRENPKTHLKLFADGASDYNEMILVDNIKVYSHCEHHMCPFLGKAAVAYIPGPKGKIVGLSKINRIVDNFARRLQVQERLTTQIANFIHEELNALGVAVHIVANHTCVQTRGVQDNSVTSTSALRGLFLHDSKARNEFYNQIKKEI